MQILNNIYRLVFFKAFTPRPEDALAPIQSRFSGKRLIFLSVGKRIRLGTVDISADGSRQISNVSVHKADGFPDKTIPDSLYSELRSLAKLQHVIVSISDSDSGFLKSMNNIEKDTEEALLISMSSDPKATIPNADSSSKVRMFQNEKLLSIVGQVSGQLISNIEEELSGFRLTPVRIAFAPMSCLDMLLAHPEVESMKAIPVVFDSGTIYALPYGGKRGWANVRKLDSGISDSQNSEVKKGSKWLQESILNESKKQGGPDKLIALDAGTSGEITLDDSLNIEFLKDEEGQPIELASIVAATLN
jgi:hypothetical protein